jgi:hypothetical protein
MAGVVATAWPIPRGHDQKPAAGVRVPGKHQRFKAVPTNSC